MSRGSTILDVLRSLVRQLAAAIYVEVAYGFFSGFLSATSYGPPALQSGLVFVTALLLGRMVAGPLWATGLVGVLTAGLDVLLSWATARAGGFEIAVDATLLGHTALLSLVGLGAAWLGRPRSASAPPAA